MSALKVRGLLADGAKGYVQSENNIRLQVRVGRTPQGMSLDYLDKVDFLNFEIGLEHVPCHFGGHRTYFVCSGVHPKCVKRCTTLYLTGVGPTCRVCTDLLYESQRHPDPTHLVALKKVQRLRAQLGGFGMGSLIPEKPKWMREDTYYRRVTHILEVWKEYVALERKHREYLLSQLDQRTGCAKQKKG
ncbi:MAG: hypothetical protein ABJP94_23395 [Paracoccaceae bacterium]